MTKIISIDTEYNNYKEPLSIGITTSDLTKEFYIKNKVDKRTFEIHGIASSYLNSKKEFHLIKKELFNHLLESDYIVGFDVEQDFQTITLRQYFTLYDNKKVIDLKNVFNFIGINGSLTSISEIFSLNESLMKTLSPHSASYDSIITFRLLDKILENGEKEGLSKDFILNELAEISKYLFNKERFPLESNNSCLIWFKKYCLNEPSIINIKKAQFYSIGKNVTILDENLNVICRFPKKYLNFESIVNLSEIIENEEYSELGIRFSDYFVNDTCSLHSK
jgi:DNA polymerase III epsilon subunit-like protein